MSARTDRELQALLHHLETLRESVRLNLKSEAEVDRALRRLVHGPATIERAAAAYVEQRHLAKKTRDGIASFLRGAGAPLARVEIAELSAPRVSAWIDGMAARGIATSSRQQYWSRLGSLVRFAAAREWIGRVPWEGWRPVFRGKRRVREREAARDVGELARIFEAACLEDDDRRARGLLPDVEAKIVTCAALGLRQGELAGLRWGDVRPELGMVRIARQWEGASLPKGAPHARALAAAPALFDLLARYRAELDARELFAADGPVFPDLEASRPGAPRAYGKGEPLTRRIVRAVIRRAHLPNEKAWSAHSLRDTFATLEERAHGTDLRSLAERTRHASLSSLLRYLRASKRAPPSPGFVLPVASGPTAPMLPAASGTRDQDADPK